MSKKNGEYNISVSQLRRMREARMGAESIADVLGCDPSTVRKWLTDFGLPRKLPPIEFSDDQIDQAIANYRHRRVAHGGKRIGHVRQR